MATTFPAKVERWRPLVSKYVPKSLVNAVLWIIQHESGGNPNAIGDEGVAVGLLQIQDNNAFPNRPNREYLLDPENNIRFAAQALGLAIGKFGAWGEGTRDRFDFPYDPSTGEGYFGALGSHPFPDDISGEVKTYRKTFGGDDGTDDGGGGGGWFDLPNPFDHIIGPFILPGSGGAGGIIGSTDDAIKAVGHILLWMLDPRHWIRLAFTALGATLFLMGIARLTGLSQKANALTQQAAMAAIPGGGAAAAAKGAAASSVKG